MFLGGESFDDVLWWVWWGCDWIIVGYEGVMVLVVLYVMLIKMLLWLVLDVGLGVLYWLYFDLVLLSIVEFYVDGVLLV